VATARSRHGVGESSRGREIENAEQVVLVAVKRRKADGRGKGVLGAEIRHHALTGSEKILRQRVGPLCQPRLVLVREVYPVIKTVSFLRGRWSSSFSGV
jgi:hypothetical protein